MALGTLISGAVIAFLKGWLMTLVVSATIPLIVIAGYLYMKTIARADEVNQQHYLKAGGIAEQAIGSVKTVKMLNGEKF